MIAAALAVAGGLVFWPYHSLAHEIASVDDALAADGKLTADIVRIEKMQEDSGPVFVEESDLKKDPAQYAELVGEVEKTELKSEGRQIGMEINGTLYTFTVASADNASAVTVSVGKDERLHINQNETTYEIRNDDSRLYELLEGYFE